MVRLVLSSAALAAVFTVLLAGMPGTPVSAADSARPATLEERRQMRRDRAVSSHITRCRAQAKRLRELRQTPCAEDDALDARRNLCVPRHGQFRPYLRWDPAAGRCRPRDRYELRSCAEAQHGRYQPGKRHAQSLADSVRMYGAAPARLETALKRCKAVLGTLRESAARRSQRSLRDCAIARRLKRGDLIAFYCD